MPASLLTTTLLFALASALLLRRRDELRGLSGVLARRARAIDAGTDRPRLAAPRIELARCLGCGSCIRACPEEGVLELAHGQAVLVQGARCQSHGLCASACPTDAITLEHPDADERRDLPALLDSLEVRGVPGLFLAGEVTGHALIRAAVSQVRTAVAEIAAGLPARSTASDELDLCIVGAGPAGLAASMEARARGLRYRTLEQEQLGGTVAAYPRRKLIMSEPLELPLGERLERAQYSKEELMKLWARLVERHELAIIEGVRVEAIEREGEGFRIRTTKAALRARRVLVACGRRGSPRKLGVPGEELPKVCFSLLDAASYGGRRVLVVGGGDSALEAAVALSEQPNCRVSLCHRGESFPRASGNQERLHSALDQGRLELLRSTTLTRVEPEAVWLQAKDEASRCIGNDDVFVLIGGRPPFELLERAGVSFDPVDRRASTRREQAHARRSPVALAVLVLSAGVLLFAWWRRDYYSLPLLVRYEADAHELLAPSGALGLAFGSAATLALLANLAYLARRAETLGFRWGELGGWMQAHMATGIAALVLTLVHAGWELRESLGGFAAWGLMALLATGLLGRYLYALVPRAANGRELEVEEVRSQLDAAAADWERRQRAHGARLFASTIEAARRATLGASLPRQLFAAGRERRFLADLEQDARALGLSREQRLAMRPLARRAWRASLAALRLERLRALLASWRYLHRWGALLVALWILAHILSACLYGGFLRGAVG